MYVTTVSVILVFMFKMQLILFRFFKQTKLLAQMVLVRKCFKVVCIPLPNICVIALWFFKILCTYLCSRKISNDLPLFKKGESSRMSNNRPVLFCSMHLIYGESVFLLMLIYIKLGGKYNWLKHL